MDFKSQLSHFHIVKWVHLEVSVDYRWMVTLEKFLSFQRDVAVANSLRSFYAPI